MKTVVLKCTDGGERLDVFLAANISGVTRNAAQRMLESGSVSLGGAALRKSHRTTPGEEYAVRLDEPEESAVVPQDIPLDIVFEDDDVIVVNKPQGMVVHPAPGHPGGTLVNALLAHCRGSLSGIGGVRRPGIVHRIDKDTSGLVIAAKNDAAHVSLAGQLSARTLKRQYDAVVCGNLKHDSGTINAPIGRHPADRKKQTVFDSRRGVPQGGQSGRGVQCVPQDGQSGQGGMKVRNAITHYEVVARYNGYTHIRCDLETGRTHQIRVHLAYLGFPVLGDMVYGRKKPAFGLTGQCLHASKLRFIHPTSGSPVELTAELPDYFVRVLKVLEGRGGS